MANEVETLKENFRGGYDIVNKFGFNPEIDTGTDPEDLWSAGGLYTFPSDAGEALEIVSTSANDAAAGTGAQTVTIMGLDENGDSKTEVATLNGITAVALTGLWSAINRMIVTTAGSGLINAGDINIQQSGGGTVFAQILIDKGQTLQAIYKVPNGKIGRIKKIWATVFEGGAAQPANCRLILERNGAQSTKQQFSVSNQSPYFFTFKIGGIDVQPLDKIWIRVDSVLTNNTAVSGGFDILYS